MKPSTKAAWHAVADELKPCLDVVILFMVVIITFVVVIGVFASLLWLVTTKPWLGIPTVGALVVLYFFIVVFVQAKRRFAYLDRDTNTINGDM